MAQKKNKKKQWITRSPPTLGNSNQTRNRSRTKRTLNVGNENTLNSSEPTRRVSHGCTKQKSIGVKWSKSLKKYIRYFFVVFIFILFTNHQQHHTTQRIRAALKVLPSCCTNLFNKSTSLLFFSAYFICFARSLFDSICIFSITSPPPPPLWMKSHYSISLAMLTVVGKSHGSDYAKKNWAIAIKRHGTQGEFPFLIRTFARTRYSFTS